MPQTFGRQYHIQLFNPFPTVSFRKRQLGAMPIAPTALTVLGGLPASRAPDMLCRIDSSTTFTFSFI